MNGRHGSNGIVSQSQSQSGAARPRSLAREIELHESKYPGSFKHDSTAKSFQLTLILSAPAHHFLLPQPLLAKISLGGLYRHVLFTCSSPLPLRFQISIRNTVESRTRGDRRRTRGGLGRLESGIIMTFGVLSQGNAMPPPSFQTNNKVRGWCRSKVSGPLIVGFYGYAWHGAQTERSVAQAKPLLLHSTSTSATNIEPDLEAFFYDPFAVTSCVALAELVAENLRKEALGFANVRALG